jgi:hypothetical protein
VSAGFTQVLAANVLRRAFSATNPFPSDTAGFRTLRSQPGAQLRATLMPRYRLSREWTIAAAYRFDHGGGTTYTASDSLGDIDLGPVERTGGWTMHSFGIGADYSTIGAFRQGRTPFPIEFSILYRTSVFGSGFAPHAGTIEAGGRILYQLVGRPRRAAAADTTAGDTARTLPRPSAPPTVTAPGEPQPRPAPPSAAPPSATPPAAPPAGEPTTQPANPRPRPVPPPPPAPPPTSVPPPE